ncbi:hypothetical protein PFISCL1PPCAC_25407, partial [Pristionchus fissidentatus]
IRVMEKKFERMTLGNRPQPSSSASSGGLLHTNVYKVETQDKAIVFKYTVLIERIVLTSQNLLSKMPLTKHGGPERANFLFN